MTEIDSTYDEFHYQSIPDIRDRRFLSPFSLLTYFIEIRCNESLRQSRRLAENSTCKFSNLRTQSTLGVVRFQADVRRIYDGYTKCILFSDIHPDNIIYAYQFCFSACIIYVYTEANIFHQNDRL